MSKAMSLVFVVCFLSIPTGTYGQKEGDFIRDEGWKVLELNTGFLRQPTRIRGGLLASGEHWGWLAPPRLAEEGSALYGNYLEYTISARPDDDESSRILVYLLARGNEGNYQIEYKCVIGLDRTAWDLGSGRHLFLRVPLFLDDGLWDEEKGYWVDEDGKVVHYGLFKKTLQELTGVLIMGGFWEIEPRDQQRQLVKVSFAPSDRSVEEISARINRLAIEETEIDSEIERLRSEKVPLIEEIGKETPPPALRTVDDTPSELKELEGKLLEESRWHIEVAKEKLSNLQQQESSMTRTRSEIPEERGKLQHLLQLLLAPEDR
ncbi:MAG: hypothetical protein GY719_31745 [bacterium]|nr:hypothetical protein [bacterium]